MLSYPLFIRIFICVASLSFASAAQSQLNRVKAGFLAFPAQLGLGMVNIGFERMNTTKTSSFQIYYSTGGGSIAADAGETKRKWVTVEKTFYVMSKQPTHFVYSIFIELGNRTKYPGYIYAPQDSIPKYTRSFELCPGIAAGFHHNFNKHWGLGLLTGPKLIFTNKQAFYHNAVSHQEFIVKAGNSVTTGLRFTPYICYQF